MSDFKDGTLGLLAGAARSLGALLHFAAVLVACFLVFGLWRGVTTVKFTNESGIDLEGVTVLARNFEGDEEPLWDMRISANDETYRFTHGCCAYIVVKHRFESYAYQLVCRYPDWEDFPEFSVVILPSGSAYCRLPRAMNQPACTRVNVNAENPEREICPELQGS